MDKLTEKEILQKIGSIISTDGEAMTDGECLDEIIQLLEENGIEWDERK